MQDVSSERTLPKARDEQAVMASNTYVHTCMREKKHFCISLKWPLLKKVSKQGHGWRKEMAHKSSQQSLHIQSRNFGSWLSSIMATNLSRISECTVSMAAIWVESRFFVQHEKDWYIDWYTWSRNWWVLLKLEHWMREVKVSDLCPLTCFSECLHESFQENVPVSW